MSVLEYICDDNGESKWFFDKETKKFSRVYHGDNQAKQIRGSNIPDPHKMWSIRCEQFGQLQGTEIATMIGGRLIEPVRLKPTDAVFALWDRWQREVTHAN